MKKLFFILCMIILGASSSFAYEINEHQLTGYQSSYSVTWTNTQRGLLSFQLAYDVWSDNGGSIVASVRACSVNFYTGNVSYKWEGVSTAPGDHTTYDQLSCGSYWDHFDIWQENWNTSGTFPNVDNWVRIDLF